MKITYYSLSNVGKIRKNNEDYYMNNKSKDLYSFVLCDGMGGKNGGEVASKIAVDSIISHIQNTKKLNFKIIINSSFNRANSNILEEAKNNSLYEGMGTTAVLVVLCENQFYIGHIGDSRAYYIVNNEIKQLTKDHSLIQQLVDDGEITSEIAAHHPMKNIITHALGSSFNSSKNYFDLNLVPVSNSYILLCSDGLNNMIDDKEITLSFSLIEPMKIAENLILKALNAGGKDNITATVIRIEENTVASRNENDGLKKTTFLNRLFKK